MSTKLLLGAGVAVLAMILGATGIASAQITSAALAPADKDAVLKLVQALEGSDAKARQEAAKSLGGYPKAAREIMPVLTEALKDPDAGARIAVAGAIGEMGELAAASPCALNVLLSDPDKDVRLAAVKAMTKLKNLGEMAPLAMNDPSPEVCDAVVDAMLLLAPNGKEAQQAVNRCKAAPPPARADALRQLAMYGPMAKAALPVMLEEMKDPAKRGTAVSYFVYLGPAAREAVPALVAALEDKSDSTRAIAANALGRMGPSAADAVPALIKQASDKSDDAASSAAFAMSKIAIAPTRKEVVECLMGALGHPNAKVRRAAVVGLGAAGPEAAGALGRLIQLLQDRDKDVPPAAAAAIGRIGPAAKDAVPALVEALKVKGAAPNAILPTVKALGEIGPEACISTGAVLDALARNPGMPELCAPATAALSRFGPAAVPDLVKGLEYKEPWVRVCAADALGLVGPSAKDAIEALTKLTQGQAHEAAKYAAIAALARIRAAPPACTVATRTQGIMWQWLVPSEGYDWVVSPDEMHYVYAAREGTSFRTFLDGRKLEGPAGTDLGTPEPLSFLFSPNSRRLAFITKPAQGGMALVVDGTAVAVLSELDKFRMLWSDDSKHIAVRVVQRGASETRMLLDGKLGEPQKLLDGVAREWMGFGDKPLFAHDGEVVTAKGIYPRLTMIESDGTRTVAGMHPIFSADGKRFAYIGFDDKSRRAVIDGVPSKQDHVVSNVHFSPDGKHAAYVATEKGETFAVVDGLELARNKEHAVMGGVFSPDGAHFAYVGTRGSDWFVVLDGKEGKAYSSKYNVPPSLPDGVVLGSLAFSPDSSRLTYVARTGNLSRVVMDGREQDPFAGIASVVFSPDSKHWACVALTTEWPGIRPSRAPQYGAFRVVDGVLGAPKAASSEGACRLAFTPDSKHTIYAMDQSVYVDETPVGEYQFPAGGCRVVFDAPEKFHFVAIKGYSVVRIDVQISR